MIWGSSLVAGFGTASLQALQPGLSFQISIKTFVAFAIGAGVLAVCWRVIVNPSTERSQKVRRFAVSALLAVAGLAGLLYPLRFVAPAQFRPLCIGIAMALCALSGVAILLLMCKRIFDADERNNAAERDADR
jgi:hypothetical protein